MRKLSLLIVVFIMAISLSCNVSSLLQAPTETPTQTPTTTSTSTPTLTPTTTQTPTPTTTPTPTITPTPIGDIVDVPEGGYKVYVPQGYIYKVSKGTIIISQLKENKLFLNIIMTNLPTTKDSTGLPLEFLLRAFLITLEKTGYSFVKEDGTKIGGDAYPITINGIEGTALEFTGLYNGSQIIGQSIAYVPDSKHIFIAISYFPTTSDRAFWTKQGEGVFHSVMESVEFVP